MFLISNLGKISSTLRKLSEAILFLSPFFLADLQKYIYRPSSTIYFQSSLILLLNAILFISPLQTISLYNHDKKPRLVLKNNSRTICSTQFGRPHRTDLTSTICGIGLNCPSQLRVFIFRFGPFTEFWF